MGKHYTAAENQLILQLDKAGVSVEAIIEALAKQGHPSRTAKAMYKQVSILRQRAQQCLPVKQPTAEADEFDEFVYVGDTVYRKCPLGEFIYLGSAVYRKCAPEDVLAILNQSAAPPPPPVSPPPPPSRPFSKEEDALIHEGVQLGFSLQEVRTELLGHGFERDLTSITSRAKYLFHHC